MWTDDTELKGGHPPPLRPCGETAIFSVLECYERAMAIGGVFRWLLVVLGSTRPKKIPKKFLARRGWFSVADVTRDFWNFR